MSNRAPPVCMAQCAHQQALGREKRGHIGHVRDQTPQLVARHDARGVTFGHPLVDNDSYPKFKTPHSTTEMEGEVRMTEMPVSDLLFVNMSL
jgi:hypothetical protein